MHDDEWKCLCREELGGRFVGVYEGSLEILRKRPDGPLPLARGNGHLFLLL